jgi:NTE family protein
MGGAWLTGALEALASETGWDPASADYLVGTSAGAMMAALCAGGVPPWFMVAHSAGEVFDGLVDAGGRPAAEADRAAGAVFRLEREWPRLGPGSWRLGLAALRNPTRHTPAAAITGWLPRGVISNQPLRDVVRRVVPHGWADHHNLWIVACEYTTGRRTVFGRHGSPSADLADAVAASCAIPGFYRPVAIDGREYVDGGIRSPSNLDLLRTCELDLAICLNPTSTRDEPAATSAVERMGAAFRRASGRRLGSEARKLREAGIETLLVQPTAADRAVMGPNLMSTRRRHDVIEKAIETVRRQLADPAARELLAGLPPGEAHRVARPPGPPSTWPQLAGLGPARP